MLSRKKGFTLLELLLTVGIVGIISAVVVFVINPVEALRQSRDSDRITDMKTLDGTLTLYLQDQPGGYLGAGNVVYVSIPDPSATSTAGDQCQGLGLPTLPATYTYQCAATSTYRKVDGTGWIPVPLSNISIGSILGVLPVDPTNKSSTRLYYTYSTNGTQYELTAAMESSRFKMTGANDVVTGDGASLSTVYAKGTNLALEPLDYGDTSLVGYWTMDEGTSTVAYDYSGNNATGTWNGTSAGTSGHYSAGKIGSWAGAFDGASSYIGLPNTTATIPFSISAWIYPTYYAASAQQTIFGPSACNGFGFYTYGTGVEADVTCQGTSGASYTYNLNQWQLVTAVYQSSNNRSLYLNGALISQNTNNFAQASSLYTSLGRTSGGTKLLDGPYRRRPHL